ncbi:uncharacterized protein LOC144887375 [Branchiostoma floridae x Branchiostoma japonicum]
MQRKVWSKKMKKLVLDVSHDWTNALAGVESALNTSTFFKDLDGHTPYKLKFGVPSSRETRDPLQPDGIRDNSREDVIQRARCYWHEARARNIDKTVSETTNELPPTRESQPREHVQQERRRQGRGILGIKRYGNTCYVLSLLQALAAVRANNKFANIAAGNHSHQNHPWNHMMPVMEMLCTVVPGNQPIKNQLAIERIKNHFLHFSNDRQQDTWEFFSAVVQYPQCPVCQGHSCLLVDRLFRVAMANFSQCVCENTSLAGHVEQHHID